MCASVRTHLNSNAIFIVYLYYFLDETQIFLTVQYDLYVYSDTKEVLCADSDSDSFIVPQ